MSARSPKWVSISMFFGRLSSGLPVFLWATSWKQSPRRRRSLSIRLPEANILHFLFDREMETGEYARLQVGDDLADLPRCAAGFVVDQVGVIIRNVNAAVANALCVHLLQEPGARHFALADQLGR